MEQTKNKIEALQKKVEILKIELETEIYEICENLDYHNSSKFSYNIDNLRQFTNNLKNFKI